MSSVSSQRIGGGSAMACTQDPRSVHRMSQIFMPRHWHKPGACRMLRVKIGSKTPSNTLQIASNIFKSEYQNLNQVSSGFKDDSERRCLKNHTGIKSWTPHRTDSFCKYLAVSLRTKFCARTTTCADQNTKSLTIFGL